MVMREPPMPTTVFSATALGFSVVQEPDGSLQCGPYLGQRVKTALPIDQGAKCILLLDRDDYTANIFKNLLCIDRSGSVVWVAPLPGSPDSFVEARMAPDGLHAGSWSCYDLVLDPQSGKVLSQVFVK
jgi:hypothetical protein